MVWDGRWAQGRAPTVRLSWGVGEMSPSGVPEKARTSVHGEQNYTLAPRVCVFRFTNQMAMECRDCCSSEQPRWLMGIT